MVDAVNTSLEGDTTRVRGLMHIGEVAERVSLSHRTVRYYDEAGLLVPARSSGNFRLFTEADVERLLLIRKMKPLGFSLEDMGHLIGLLDGAAAGATTEEDRTAFLEFVLDAQKRRERMAEQLQAADLLIDNLRALT